LFPSIENDRVIVVTVFRHPDRTRDKAKRGRGEWIMASPSGMRSYKLVQFGAPLTEVIESPPAPKGAQVLLRVSACGVCHSDLHVADGYFDLGQGQKLDLAPAVKLPRILGHEIAGVVEELGPEATGVKVGDRRAIYAWAGCGRCAQCWAGQENLCAKPRNLSVHADGGFSSYVLVEHPRYLVEHEPLPAPFAATLGCSGLTAFSALKKAAPVEAEHPLLIIGAGGLGLAAVSLCHALYGLGPIVADIDAAKRHAALAAGASAVIDPADPDARKSLLAATGGMFSAIDFVGAEKSAAFGLSLLRKGGRLFVVGLFGGSLAISLPTLPIRAVSIIGVYTGSLPEFRELMALAREGKVRAGPIETRPLETAQQSLDDLRAGHVRGRIVLTA
jgi:D-arabinose 1-dehydrogenase-like Zn-dependent alcohol dehydrogenase